MKTDLRPAAPDLAIQRSSIEGELTMDTDGNVLLDGEDLRDLIEEHLVFAPSPDGGPPVWTYPFRVRITIEDLQS